MKISQAIFLILASVVITIAVGFFIFNPKGTGTTSAPTHKETAYERVMRTGTIRCGYFTWRNFLDKGMTTGKFSGIFYDIMEELGHNLGLKIEWTEEVQFAFMFEGFKTGRYDMICGPITPSPERILASDFTVPIGYVPFYIYSRGSDTRFDNNLASINNPLVRLAYMDGDIGSSVAREKFPLAKLFSAINLTDSGQMLMEVANGKADVTVAEANIAFSYMKNNPGKIKIVQGGLVRTMPFSMALSPNEERLKTVINQTLQYMLDEGFFDRTYKKHLEFDGGVLRMAQPYEVQK